MGRGNVGIKDHPGLALWLPLIIRPVSNPDISGSITSMMTMSGLKESTRRTTSRPLPGYLHLVALILQFLQA